LAFSLFHALAVAMAQRHHHPLRLHVREYLLKCVRVAAVQALHHRRQVAHREKMATQVNEVEHVGNKFDNSLFFRIFTPTN
jgi:hypothetical protein